MAKVSGDGKNVTAVPLRSPSSKSRIGSKSPMASPCLNFMYHSLPSRRIFNSRYSDNALTTDTPTPCKPPDTLYELSSNLPPACSCVIITCAAETFSSSCSPTGIPRPLSFTVTEPSAFNITSMRSQYPANDSSIALSTTSYTMWCKPVPSSVSPIYIPGRLRTASSPRKTLMESAP